MNGYAPLSFNGVAKQRERKKTWRSRDDSRERSNGDHELIEVSNEPNINSHEVDDGWIIGDWVEVRDLEDSAWFVGKVVAREANGSPRVLAQGFERAYVWDLIRRKPRSDTLFFQHQNYQHQPHDDNINNQQQPHHRQTARSDNCAFTPASSSASTARVLTFNSWVGDARRGFCSRDSERLGWIAKQLRAANVDVLCLQEVLEADMQKVTF